MKFCLNCWLLLALLSAVGRAEPLPPRLAVLIVVDQMRGDYLTRFGSYFGPDGFRRLQGGADYQNCHYRHAITKTAPGHATILSGVHADVHGIIGNDWLDRITFIAGNAVEDVDTPLVGLPSRSSRYPNATLAAKAGRSPRNFLGTTVGDRLKARYGPAAKVFGVADKDRSAILPAGPRADGAYWTEEGIFVTSTYYRDALPVWVTAFNTAHNAAQHYGEIWDRLKDVALYDVVQGPDEAPGESPADGLPITFPKRVDGGEPAPTGRFFSAFDHAPWNNDLVAAMAERLIEAEQLGQDDIPDLLTIGFSQTDKVGHAYGPDSHEVMDSYLRLDGTLAGLLAFLDAKVGQDRYVVVLTADHGVGQLPERIQAEQGRDAAGRIDAGELNALGEQALTSAFGPLEQPLFWMVRYSNAYHLNPRALAAKGLALEPVAAVLRDALVRHPGVAAAYTRGQLTGPDPLDSPGEMLRLSYYPPRSADVEYILRPNFMIRRLGVDHGTPHDYDTHVPQVWYGAGVVSGVHPEPVAVEDIAPTLAGLLGLDLPAARGRRLF